MFCLKPGMFWLEFASALHLSCHERPGTWGCLGQERFNADTDSNKNTSVLKLWTQAQSQTLGVKATKYIVLAAIKFLNNQGLSDNSEIWQLVFLCQKEKAFNQKHGICRIFTAYLYPCWQEQELNVLQARKSRTIYNLQILSDLKKELLKVSILIYLDWIVVQQEHLDVFCSRKSIPSDNIYN